MQLQVGQQVIFSHNGKESRGEVDWDRGGYRYDLVVDGVPFSETQAVPCGPTPDDYGRHCWPVGDVLVPPEKVEEHKAVLMSRTPPPSWPLYAALGLGAVSTGLSILALLSR